MFTTCGQFGLESWSLRQLPLVGHNALIPLLLGSKVHKMGNMDHLYSQYITDVHSLSLIRVYIQYRNNQ